MDAAHDYGDEHLVPQAYLPESRIYYYPTVNGMELHIAEHMEILAPPLRAGQSGLTCRPDFSDMGTSSHTEQD